jgi:ribosomal protein S1
MTEKILEGTITFVQYDKKYITIEYMHNGKAKTVNGSIKEADLLKGNEAKSAKKLHHFREGDNVNFILTRSPRGDKMIADNIQFRFNNSLSALLHKATIDNKFSGYLKQVDDKYFIKEIGSYHFFPLKLSPWEKEPAPADLNEPVLFSLENFTNPDKATAILVNRQFIPEFKKAKQYFDNKTVIDATVFKISPHGIYVHVTGNKIQAKVPLPPAGKAGVTEKPGDTMKIIITYLGEEKIVVKRV